MLVLGPSNAEIGRLGDHGVELDLGSREVLVGIDAALIKRAGQSERVPVGGDRIRINLALLVRGAQCKVIVRELCLRAQDRRCDVCGARLGGEDAAS
jgi:hypothetical protein